MNIASTLSPSEIDAALEKIAEVEDRIRVLSDVSELGPTPKRIELLCEGLPQVLHRPLNMPLARAVDRLWSTPVAEAVVCAVARATWPPPFGSRIVRDTLNVVAKRITREIATSIVHPQIAEATDRESREIIEWWYELGMQVRRSG